MPAKREHLIREAYAAFAARDREALVRLSDPEVELRTMTGRLAGRSEPYRGHEGIGRYLDDTEGVWTKIELHPQQFNEIDDERMLVFGRTRAWRGHTMIDTPSAWVWTVRDGKIRGVEVFATPADVPEVFGF